MAAVCGKDGGKNCRESDRVVKDISELVGVRMRTVYGL
jgi:hypothetical protein